MAGRMSGADLVRAQTIVQEAQRIEEALVRFGNGIFTFGDVMAQFQHAVRLDDIQDPQGKLDILTSMLRQIGVVIREGDIFAGADRLALREQRQLTELIADLQREITDVEVQARRDQADHIIAAIREQDQRVREALEDQEEASKRAALRQVASRFDVEEAVIRRSFLPALTGAAGDPFETARIVAEAQNEIALLALAEEAAANTELAAIRAAFENAATASGEATDRRVLAIETAAEQSDVAFSQALATNVFDLTGDVTNALNVASATSTADLTSVLTGTTLTIAGMREGVQVRLDDVAAKVSGVPDIVVGIGQVQSDVFLAAAQYGNPQWALVHGFLENIDHNTAVTAGRLGDVNMSLSSLEMSVHNPAWARVAGEERRDIVSSLGTVVERLNSAITSINDPLWTLVLGTRMEEALMAAHDPAWAREANFGGGGGGGGTNNFDIDVNLNVEGSPPLDPHEFWDTIEFLIVESMHGGAIGTELMNILQALGIEVTNPPLPSNIRT